MKRNPTDEIENISLSAKQIKAKLEDKSRYQTVYSKIEGSSAAPTAGLHFTPELLTKIKNYGTLFLTITE